MIKKVIILLVCIGWIQVIGSQCVCEEKSTVSIKLATLAPKGSGMVTKLEKLVVQIKEETQGSVDFKIYWGGVQGDEKNVLRKIRLNQLHGGFFSGSGLGEIVPDIRVTEIPYVFNTYDEVVYVRHELESYMDNRFREAGFEVLGWYNIGFIYTFSSVPITSLETLKQQKCWVPGDDPLGEAIYKAFDVTPISLSITDVMTSVTTNIINTAGMTPFGAMAFRWYTKFKYMSNFPTMNVIGAQIVTQKLWNQITPEYQKKIKTLFRNFAENENIEIQRANDQSIDLLKKAGVEVVHIEASQGNIQFLIDAGKKARESLIGNLYSKELLEKTLSTLEAYRKQHPENNVFQMIQQ
ncbi:MAG: TRAP transporter substrate-binding protein DctP [Desulfobacterales bacterium]|nr:TRAP transporter substrate-binding protein DctP [Desulfobacterales bacterium]